MQVIANVLFLSWIYITMYKTRKAFITNITLFELTLLIIMHINFELNQNNEVGDKIGKDGTQKWFA